MAVPGPSTRFIRADADLGCTVLHHLLGAGSAGRKPQPCNFALRVQGSGFRGLGFRVQGLGCALGVFSPENEADSDDADCPQGGEEV